MSAKIEREFKLFLPSEAALDSLVARLGGARGTPLTQTNHFFDAASGALRRARLVCRLREEEGRHTLTLKGPSIVSTHSFVARPEEELELDAPTAAALLAGRKGPLEILRASALRAEALVRSAAELVAGAPLLRIGTFENERLRIGPLDFPPGSGAAPLVFEFDRTRFPGGVVERELELELPDASRADEIAAALRSLFGELGIPVRTMDSKAARLFRILDSRKGQVPDTRGAPG